MTYVALLRGINVGKAKAVAMSDLRAIVESAGHRDVRTLLRSGNVVFRSGETPGRLAVALEEAIAKRLGLDVRVVLRTAAELEAVVAANPIAEAAGAGSNMHVMFLAEPLSGDERARISAAAFDPDVVRPAGSEIYVLYRNGMSGSATAEVLGRIVRGTVTDRNWNTVSKLLGMARELG